MITPQDVEMVAAEVAHASDDNIAYRVYVNPVADNMVMRASITFHAMEAFAIAPNEMVVPQVEKIIARARAALTGYVASWIKKT